MSPRVRQRWRKYGPRIECLEDRVVPADDLFGDTIASAHLVQLVPGVRTTLADAIAPPSPDLPPNDVDFFAVDLDEGALLVVDVDAEVLGSSLDSYLRVFDEGGAELPGNDDADGLDSALQFTAPTAGRYFFGLSSYDNSEYDPNLANSGLAGGEGEYSLGLVLPQPLDGDD